MPRNPCNPCPPVPDNCYAECVKCCVEKCKTFCCERKYLKLAHKLLDSGLFVDTANYTRNQVHQARVDAQFYNIVNLWAQPGLIPPSNVDDSTDPIYVNNQPNNLLSLKNLGYAHNTVILFTRTELTTYSANSDFKFIMDPILTLVFSVDITVAPYNAIQSAITAAKDKDTGNAALLAYLRALQVAVGKVLDDVLPGGLTQVLLGNDTPYVTNTEYLTIDYVDVVNPVVLHTGKAALVSKQTASSPVLDAYLLLFTGTRVVDKYGPLPGPCDA